MTDAPHPDLLYRLLDPRAVGAAEQQIGGAWRETPPHCWAGRTTRPANGRNAEGMWASEVEL